MESPRRPTSASAASSGSASAAGGSGSRPTVPAVKRVKPLAAGTAPARAAARIQLLLSQADRQSAARRLSNRAT